MMIDIWSNQGNHYISRSITTHGQMRRLPHQSAKHSTVDHGDASDGVFLLLHLWVLPSRWVILLRRSPSSLSLACWWPFGANGSLLCEWRRLPDFRVEDPSGARKGGPNWPRSGPGRPAWADRPKPIPAWFGRPFAPVGPQVIMHFAPSICMILTMSSSRPRWWFSVHVVRSFTLQSPRVFLRSTSVLATIGSDFIKLMNTNKNP
jgi:hypothetical protein